MLHGPDPYAQALADLDAHLAQTDRRIEQWAIAVARKADLIARLEHSVRAAFDAALREPLTPPVRQQLVAALGQFDEVTR